MEIDARVEIGTSQRVEQVLGGEVALGHRAGVGAAAEPADRAVDGGDTGVDGGERVRQPHPVGVVPVERHRGEIADRGQRSEQLVDLLGTADTDRVGDAHLVASHLEERGHQSLHVIDGNVALVGAAGHGRHIAAHTEAGLDGAACDLGEHHHALVDRTVDVAMAELLAGGAEHGDLRHSRRRCRLEASTVRSEGDRPQTRQADDRLGDRRAVGELRDPVGPHERGHLHPVQAGGVQPPDQFDLVGARDRGRLALEPVPRADLDDPERCCRRHLVSLPELADRSGAARQPAPVMGEVVEDHLETDRGDPHRPGLSPAAPDDGATRRATAECRAVRSRWVNETASTTVTPDEAMSLVRDGAKVVAAPTCGSPSTLLAALAARSHRGPVTLFTGIQIDGYPFLDAIDPERFRLITWHVNGPLRTRIGDGVVDYVPARSSQVAGLIATWDIDVTLIRVSPADDDGFHSLGPTASYAPAAMRSSSVVIAEVDPAVPRTFGASVHRSEITALVESELPMPEYHMATSDPVSDAIARRVLELLPSRPTLQLGIGSIPEALTTCLAEADLGPLRFVGMVTDAIAGLADRLDTTGRYPDPAVLAAEVMGTRVVMDFVHENPLVGVRDSTISQHPLVLGGRERLVSVNTAVEVDLTGQVNAESVRGRQISGIGGSIDFAETALHSPGGLRILAISSTTPDGRHSRIVPAIAPGAPVTHTRTSIDLVVTEHGIADLRGRTLGERRDALLAICAPSLRAEIAEQ